MEWTKERFKNFIDEEQALKEHLAEIANALYDASIVITYDNYYYNSMEFTDNLEYELTEKGNILVWEGDDDDYTSNRISREFPLEYLWNKDFLEKELDRLKKEKMENEIKKAERDAILKEKHNKEEYERFLELKKKFEQ